MKELNQVMEKDSIFGNRVARFAMKTYTERGSSKIVHSIVEQIYFRVTNQRDLINIMRILLKNNLAQDALDLYHKYNKEEYRDNIYLRSCLLQCCSALHDFQGLQQAFEESFGRGDMPNLSTL